MSRHVTFITWDEVPHLSTEDKNAIIASYSPHERDARTKGIPTLGSGAIYPVPEEDFVCDPIQLEPWFRRSYGLDVGWNRTAAIWTALDPETDVLYAYAEHYRGQAEPAIHAAAILAKGSWIPGVVDPAARGRAQKDGEQLLRIYLELGLQLGVANNAVEAGIYEVFSRLSTGRLKIFKTCVNMLQEIRIYRRDEKGAIVKQNDHCLTGDTRVRTRRGVFPIRDLVGTEGEIVTFDGVFAPYRHCRLTARAQPLVRIVFSDGTTVRCTEEHRFWTDHGWVLARDLADAVCYPAVTNSIEAVACESSRFPTRFKSLWAFLTTVAASIFKMLACGFTGSYGKLQTAGAYQTGFTSTTWTKTKPTTSLKIWIASRALSTFLGTKKVIHADFQRRRGPRPRVGMEALKASHGIVSTLRTVQASIRCGLLAANSAVVHSQRRTKAEIVFARIIAGTKHAWRRAWTTNHAHARSVARSTGPIATARKNTVPAAAPVWCLAVKKLASREDVYCLEVPDTHAFALENGVLVHNCMDAIRYNVLSGIARASPVPVELLRSMPGVTQRKKPEETYHPFQEAYAAIKPRGQQPQGWMPGRR